MPLRTLNCAIDFFGAARHRLLAGDARELVGAGVDDLGVRVASPRPMLTTTFSILGTAITFL
jgi:hypothetical protein